MRRTIFTETTTYRRAVSRAIGLAAGAALVGGCTMTPWTDNWQPSGQQPQPSRQSQAGVLAGYYRVNPGDTLPGVAAGFGQRVQDLANWNHIAPTDMLTPGQVLRVAPPLGSTAVTSPVPAGTAPSASALPGTPPAEAQPALAWPAQGTVTSRFIPGRTRGITITSTGDKTVRAAAAGRVVYAGNGVAKYGPLVILKHESGLITAYGHNGKLLVNDGDAVSAGQPVAEMDTNPDGRASFDFEVRQDGKPVDPMTFLPRNGG
ncbi:peptidoglycan DD-metalloendopeptidase family protein [Burkholderia plantarii]|uniref:peptidoglycan DD-metalloendopeptidase family protein n=1 Tax=Burkholderia plantarii TaxID=41899 RepID=UPI0008708109|nr:peptidoglycan DD-metalloendopeptidase family protein [Burkholderia plantarii]